MSLENLYQLVGSQPTVQNLAQVYPSLMYAFQHPLEAIEGYMKWIGTQSNNQNGGDSAMDYLGMAQAAIGDIKSSIQIVNTNIKGLYEELEKVNAVQQEILRNQQAILEAAKEVE